jgi:hypothetical protein
LQASETLLKTTGQIAFIGSLGLDAVRLATRWTDQVCVIHELPVGGTAISAKPTPTSFAVLPAASQAATSSRVFLRVEQRRSPGPESRVAFTHTFGSGEAAMRLLRRICTPCVSIAFRRVMGATVVVMIFVPSFIR